MIQETLVEVNLITKGKWCNQILRVDKSMLGTSQDLINRDLIYLISPTKKAGLYLAKKAILKFFYIS